MACLQLSLPNIDIRDDTRPLQTYHVDLEKNILILPTVS